MESIYFLYYCFYFFLSFKFYFYLCLFESPIFFILFDLLIVKNQFRVRWETTLGYFTLSILLTTILAILTLL